MQILTINDFTDIYALKKIWFFDKNKNDASFWSEDLFNLIDRKRKHFTMQIKILLFF
jgi:hypothetical protein